MAIVVGTTYSQDGTRSGGSNNNTWAGIDYVLVSQNINNNTSTIRIRPWMQRNTSSSGSWDYDDATMYIKCDGQQKTTVIDYDMRNTSYNTKYYVTSSIPFRRISGESEPYEFTFYHNNDGTKTVNLYAFIPINNGGTVGDYTVNINVELPTIPRRATLSSAQDFTDEGNPTVTYSNLAGTSVDELDVGIYSTDGGTTYADYRATSKTGTSYTFSLTTSERNALRNACSSNSMQVSFYLRTKIGGTYYYSILTKTLSIVNANPTFTTFTYKDYSSATVPLTGNDQKIINGESKVQVTISSANKAVANKGATMKGYYIDGNWIAYSSSDIVYQTSYYSKNYITVVAEDSRGNSTTQTINFGSNFINYTKPTISSLTATRTNSVGVETKLNFSGTWWNDNFGASANSLTISYKYKKTSDSSYTTGSTTITPTISGNNYSKSDISIAGDLTTGFTIANSFDIQLEVKDLRNTRTYNVVLIAGQPAIIIEDNIVKNINTNSCNLVEISNYSTTEQVVGQWIDGKPIYRKVIDFGALPNTSSTNYSITSLSVDNIIKLRGLAKKSNNDFTELPTSGIGADGKAIELYGYHNEIITIKTYNDRSGFNAYIIFEYTKTTD